MRHYKLLFTTLFFTLISTGLFSQGKLSKLQYERYRLQYSGEYKKALDVSNEIIHLIDKKYTPIPFKHDKAMEFAHQSELMRLLGKGKGEIDSKSLLAITLADGTFGKDSWKANQVRLHCLHNQIEFGDLTQVQSKIDEIRSIAKQNDWDEIKVNEIERCQIKYYFATGFYLEALELHEKIATQQEKKIVTHSDVVHPKKGTIKSKKLKKESYAKLQREYTEFSQLKGKILLDRGDYNSALQDFKNTEQWIKSNMGNGDASNLTNNYYLALTNNELKIEEASIDLFEEIDKKKYVSTYDLRIEETSEIIRNTNLFLAAYYTKESSASSIGELLYSKTRRKLVNYNKGSEREPLDRLIQAIAYYNQHNYPAAIDEYEDVKKDYYDLLKNSPSGIEFLELGIMFYKKMDREKEINLTIKELETLYDKYYPQHCPKRDLLDAKKGIINSQYSNDFDLSLTLLEGVFKSSLSEQLHPQSKYYLEILDNMAISQQYLENFEGAIETLKKGILSGEQYSKTTNPHYIEALYNIKVAALYFNIGYIDDFKEYYQQADKLLTQIKENSKKEDLRRVDYCLLDARYQILLGDLENAENALENAYKLTHKELKKFKDDPHTHGDFEELIILDIKKGDYTNAEDKIFTSLRNKEQIYGKDSRRLIKTLSQLADLYLVKGDLANSSKIINRNLDIARVNYGKKSLTYGEILNYRGILLSNLGDYEGAIIAFNEVLGIYSNFFTEEHILVAQALSSKGLAMMHSNNHNASETHQILIKASKIIESALRTRKSPAFAESIQNLALFSIQNKQLDQAEKMLTLATSIWENLPGINKVNIHTAAILMLEGDIYKSKKEYDLAKEKYEKGKKYYESIFDDKHPNYIYALSKLSKIYFIQNDEKNVRLSIDEIAEHHIEFIRKYFPSLNERDKTKYWNIINTDFEFYNNIAFKYQDEKYIRNAYDYALITKALLLNSSIKVRTNILSSNDSTLIAEFNLYTKKNEQLASILSKSSEDLREQGVDKEHLIKEINDLEVFLSERSEYFNASKKKNSAMQWNDIQKTLEEDEYAIEILRYRKFKTDFTDSVQYTALVLSTESKKAPVAIHINAGHELETKHIHYYRNTTKFKTLDKSSYTYFWKPVYEYVGDSSTIYLSADGVYNQINLEALAINDKEYVIDKNNIILVNNTKSIIDIKNQLDETIEIDHYASLVCNPNFYKANEDSKSHSNIDYHQSIKQLPGTEEEVKSIAKILENSKWKTDLYIFNETSEDAIKQITNPRILHFASHGFFLDHNKISSLSENSLDDKKAIENPLLRSGILLKYAGDIIENLDPHDYNTQDGILTAYEVKNMNLDKTDLIILSACETGRGKVHNGEGVYGLQRAFLVAGAKSVIMSLFKVDDNVTKELMEAFYKHWSKTDDKRKAFQLAKNEIRLKYPEPIYWGAFVMVGK